MDNRSPDQAEQVNAVPLRSVICEAISLSLARRAGPHRAGPGRAYLDHPEGVERSFAQVTIDGWVVAYRRDGLGGLRPTPRRSRTGRARRAGGSKKRRGCARRCRHDPQPRSLTPSPGPMACCSPKAHGAGLLRRSGLTRVPR